ncbi:MAG: hypothetical protein JXR91_10575 [Deltaproteobacteria bacterium]|nr:hypothetical protein [Deltaproteobacteria bacterium]
MSQRILTLIKKTELEQITYHNLLKETQMQLNKLHNRMDALSLKEAFIIGMSKNNSHYQVTSGMQLKTASLFEEKNKKALSAINSELAKIEMDSKIIIGKLQTIKNHLATKQRLLNHLLNK